MKKLILLIVSIVAIFSCAAFGDVGPVGRSTTLDGKGVIRDGGVEKWFINVKNGGSAMNDGDVVVLDTSADDGFTIATSATAGATPLCILDVACAAGAVCRCQTWGLKTNVNFDSDSGVATPGEQVFISENNAGFVQSQVIGSIVASDRSIGIFYDAVTATADVEVFIKLR